MRAFAGVLLLLLSPLSGAEGLSPLDDADLSAVSGQEGVAVDLSLYINADATGNPLPSLGSCTGTNSPCRMAFQFHNRGSGGGEWIVWKNMFGLVKLNNLWIDAGQTPATASPYPDTATNSRFMGGAGGTTCLVTGTVITATACADATRNLPMLSLQFNQGGAGGLQAFLHLGGVMVEYGATGYNLDTAGRPPAVGLLVGDTRGTDLVTPAAYAAQIKVGGKIGLYGF